MKKTLIIVIAIIMLFNFIMPTSYAGLLDGILSEEVYKKLIDGKADITTESDNSSKSNKRTEKIILQKSSSGAIAGSVAVILTVPANFISMILTLSVTSDLEEIGSNRFTIQDVVLNKYNIFNINVFNNLEDIEDKSSTIIVNSSMKSIVRTWYMVIRTFALVASLIIIIYIGIRMAMSTVLDDRAKYKKMMINWFTSVILIFIMHFIIIVLLQFSEFILSILQNIVGNERGFEESMLGLHELSFKKAKGWTVLPTLIFYYLLVYYQLKFFLLYIGRFLEIMFLIIIAPLVTITYSMDKVKDNRAQAFQAWLKTLILRVGIQAIHAIIYIIFIFSAKYIAEKVPLFAVLFFSGLSRAEKIVRNALNARGKGLTEVKLPFLR